MQKEKKKFAIISPKEVVRLRCHQHAAGVLPRRGPQTGHGPTSGLPSKPGMSVGEPILPRGNGSILRAGWSGPIRENPLVKIVFRRMASIPHLAC